MTDKMLVPKDSMAVGSVFAKSGYFLDAKDEAKAIVKVMAGRSLGLSDVAAMTGIDMIKGQLSLRAVTMAAILKGRGKYDYRIREHTNEICQIEFFEGPAKEGDSLGISEFTLEDAKTAGLFTRNPNYKKYPRNMLFSRAMSNGIKWFCPDTFGCPAYTPGELDNDEADVIEGQVISVEQREFEAELENNEYDLFKKKVLELKDQPLPQIHRVIKESFNGDYSLPEIAKVLNG